MSQLKNFRDSVYILKRDYGQPVDIYSKTEVVDIRTGKRIVTKSKVRIDLAILMPSIEAIKSQYNQSYRANRQGEFNYGGYLELIDKVCIIDNRDIPIGFAVNPQTDYVIVLNTNERYEISKIIQNEKDAGMTLGLKEAKGTQLSQIVDQIINHRFRIYQVAIGTK